MDTCEYATDMPYKEEKLREGSYYCLNIERYAYISHPGELFPPPLDGIPFHHSKTLQHFVQGYPFLHLVDRESENQSLLTKDGPG